MTQEEPPKAAQTGQYYYGTGRRKSAVARVRLYAGPGEIVINGRPYLDFFHRVIQQNRVTLPLQVTGMAGTFNVQAKVAGGGVAGWADALAHGVSRALVAFDEGLKPALRKAGLMTRDPRVKERKKPGLKRARKAPQYTKR